MDPNHIIREIEAYAAATGMKPSTICQMALGNARFHQRAKRRIEKYATEAAKLRAFIAANPPPSREDAVT
ncbi:hypothetical protein FGK64_16850 [Arenibacterium halophilum]|uniref:Uncharacterized protein n=1 Tax=Arenibacterium halophilum TaxID=2583821 RepID=A0ABY2X901_9RHOB|nr:hypothetical protein FGK64_16850 [Arenibacterium halophilum]